MRLAIIGTSGAGKTTLGREISRRLGATFIEVDAIHNKANWIEATDEELRKGIETAIDGRNSWVIDEVCYRQLGTFVSDRVDAILWLDLPLSLKTWRLCLRSWRSIRTREPLWNGNIETWRSALPLILELPRIHFAHRRAFPARPYASKIVRLRTRKEVTSWLESFGGSQQ